MLKSLRLLGLVSGDYSTVTTTLDLYSQAIDAAKLEAQEEIAVAITRSEMLTSASAFFKEETMLNRSE